MSDYYKRQSLAFEKVVSLVNELGEKGISEERLIYDVSIACAVPQVAVRRFVNHAIRRKVFRRASGRVYINRPDKPPPESIQNKT